MSTPPPNRVLYVDDEVALLEITQLFLERTGEIAVDITADPLEAYDMIVTGRYDAVVSDYQMPVMDGIALLKRARESGSQVPFIIFTGRGREEVAIEALNSGADFYIQKGGDPKAQFAELANAIQQLAGRQKAEVAVRKTREILQKTEALAHLGSWVLDCRTGDLTWSDETYRIFGLDPGGRAMTYEAFLSMIHPDDRDLADTAYSTSVADGEDTYTVEHRLIRADTGETRCVVEHGEHLRDESGQIISSIGMVYDITERKLAELDLLQNHKDLQAAYEQLTSIEEELRTSFDDLAENQRQLQESERRLADIIDFLPDATFVIDESGHVIAWNRAMEKMTGILKVDMLGKSDYAYAVPFYGEARPALIDYVLRPDKLVDYPYNISVEDGDLLEGEIALASPGGREVTLMVRASPLYDRKGRRVGAIEIVRDITAQKQAEAELRGNHEELQAAHEELTSIEEELRTSFDDLARSQRHLQESEDLYRRISESISDAVYVCDFKDTGEHIISRITGAVHEITGYTDEEVLAMQCWGHLVHPDDRPIFEREILSLSPNTSSTTEFRVVRKDGSIRWLHVSANCIRSQNGGTQLYGGLHDITGRKKAEEALQESEQHFRTLANSGQALIWMSGLDRGPDYFNEQWLAFTGRPLEEEVDNGWIEGVHPDDRAKCVRILKAPVARREPFSAIYRLRRNDGEYRWIQDDGTPRYDTWGNLIGFVGHCLDVTERRETERKLQKTADLMENIIRVAPTGIGMIVDKVFTEVNPQLCEITGYSRDELIGQSVRLFYPEEARYRTEREVMREKIEKTGKCERETRLLRKDGTKSDVQISIAPIDQEDLSRGMAFTVLDITENKAMEQEIEYHSGELLRQTNSLAIANKKLTLMNSITRHDVLNQLTILFGNLSFAQEDTESGKDISNYLSRVRSAADRIQRQIEFTRDYTDVGVKAPEWQRISDAIWSATQNKLPIDDETGDLAIYADLMLVRVFTNLMDNTIRHGGPVSRVHIRYRVEDNSDLVLVWEDDGIGIPAEKKEEIFKRGVGENTGLGLFLIREILGITNITITETGKPGKGARFEMLVPEGMYRI